MAQSKSLIKKMVISQRFLYVYQRLNLLFPMVFLWLKLDHSFSIGLPMVKLGSPIWKETAKKNGALNDTTGKHRSGSFLWEIWGMVY
jgi:hypothetical protein